MRLQPFLARLPDERLRHFGREAMLWAVTLFLMQAFVPSGYLKLHAYTSELPSLCFSAALMLARWPFRGNAHGQS